MSQKQTRTCCVCHNNYTFCPVCNSEDRNKPTWYFAYCSENCRDIYKVTSDYENGQINAYDARLILDKLELTNLQNFGESYQKTVARINKDMTEKNVEKNDKPVISNKDYKKPQIKKVVKIGKVE